MPGITIINDNTSFSSSSSSTASLPAPLPIPSPVPASVLASSSTVNIIPHNHNHNHNHRSPARRKSALSSWLARHVPPRVVLVLGLHRLAARREQCSCRDCNCEREREREDKEEEEDEGEEEEAADYAAFCNAFTASTSAWDKESPGHGCDKALTPASPPLSTPLPLPPPGVTTPSLHVATEKKPRPERGSKRGRCFGSFRSWCSRR